jgi:hypothetical protein
VIGGGETNGERVKNKRNAFMGMREIIYRQYDRKMFSSTCVELT